MEKYLSILMLSIFMFLSDLADADVWNIEKTINAALASSDKSKIENIKSLSADLDETSAKMGWFPTVSFSASGKYVNKVMEINMPFKTIQFGDNDSYDLKVQVNQLIFDSGRLRSLRESASHRSLAFEKQKESVELVTEYQAKAVFYSVLSGIKNIEAAESSVREAENHLKEVDARYKQGMVLETNLLMSKLRVSQAKMDLVSKQADLDKYKALFRKITGGEGDVEISMNDSMKTIDNVRAFSGLLEKRPELKAFSETILSYDRNARAAKSEALPVVGLFGAYNYGQPGLDLPKNEWMNYFTTGVYLNWNVWDWGSAKRNSEKMILSKKVTEREKSDFEKTLRQNLDEAVAEYEKSCKRVDLAKEAFDYSKENLSQTNKLYKEGMATETDYDNAHSAFTRAASEISVSDAIRNLALAQLEYVLGIRYNGGKNE